MATFRAGFSNDFLGAKGDFIFPDVGIPLSVSSISVGSDIDVFIEGLREFRASMQNGIPKSQTRGEGVAHEIFHPSI